MRWPDWLEKGWPVVLAVLLATAAYAHARGLTQLVAAELNEGFARVRPAPSVKRSKEALADADPILERNVFDSVTGPLTGMPAPPPPTTASPAAPPAAPSLTQCDFGEVTSIIAAAPSYAFASITTKGGKRELYDVGDVVGDLQIRRIDWNRVWLSGGEAACSMKLGEKIAKAKPKRRSRRKRSARSSVPKAIGDKINKVGPGEYTIERTAFEEVLKRQTELMRQTRVRPVKKGGKVVGLRVRVRKGTLLDAIGLKNGDVISSINGFDLTNPQKALEAYGRLKQADSLSLSFERKGKTETLEYRIL